MLQIHQVNVKLFKYKKHTNQIKGWKMSSF
jgi:hypothetical protein